MFDVNFIAANSYNVGWKNQNFGSTYQKLPCPNNTGAPNNYNSGASNGNHRILEETLKSFISTQNKQNNTFTEKLESHDNCLGQMTNKIAGHTVDVQALLGRTHNMEAQVATKLKVKPSSFLSLKASQDIIR